MGRRRAERWWEFRTMIVREKTTAGQQDDRRKEKGQRRDNGRQEERERTTVGQHGRQEEREMTTVGLHGRKEERERTMVGLHGYDRRKEKGQWRTTQMTGGKRTDNGGTIRHWIVNKILPTVASQYVGVGVVSTGFRECIAIQGVVLGVS
jgi:hypothetical protein